MGHVRLLDRLPNESDEAMPDLGQARGRFCCARSSKFQVALVLQGVGYGDRATIDCKNPSCLRVQGMLPKRSLKEPPR